VAMWYTFSPEYAEKTHREAFDLLDELQLETGWVPGEPTQKGHTVKQCLR